MRRALWTLTLLVFACGENGQMTAIDVADGTAGASDVGLDLPEEAPAPDTVPDLLENDAADAWVLDLAHDETTSLCAPGEGCFLDPCTQGEECLSGWCVNHMGESVCTLQCTEECPPGWSCQQVAGTAPDLVFVCVSDFANLCRPCNTGDNCKSVAGAEDVCVAYGDDGAFCGGGCATDDDCPWGFSCADTQTTDGIDTRQCVADTGECPCTPQAVELALWTSCARSNEFGTCTGKRVCSNDGLTPCSAVEPAQETCDGQDNDCNGEVDDVSCDDANPCTDDACDPEAGCTHEPLTGTECTDGDVCTLADHCDDGACVGTAINCDDNNPCTDDACNPTGGCINENNLLPCDDGDPCTVKDTCGDGTCSGFDVACDCQADSDCAALEDGDACNGTLLCDTGKIPYRCAVAPETVVECPAPTGPDAPCLEPLCDPETGECSMAAAHDGMPCDDANPCTASDQCAQGTCAGLGQVNCNDGNPCTDDFCDPVAGCLHEPNTQPCQDGDACTVGDTCQDGACAPGPVKSCDDGNVCTDDACEPAQGCVHSANAAACDDQNECTTGDQCVNGTCLGTGSLECDDANPCTKDICLPAGGCDHVNLDGAPCQDGDACTSGDQCQQGVCEPGPVLNCDDSNPCTDDACVKGACFHTPNQAECDDGNACTKTSACQDGKCAAGELVTCDDGNLCTTDFCHPTTGCQTLDNENPCDDGNACTAQDACQDGVCTGGPAVVCNDGNACTDDQCAPASGCTFTPNQAPCDDGNACTLEDQCDNGACKGAGALDCDDDTICTADSCDPALGCVYGIIAPCCGNGLVEPPEECDDGNNASDDECLANCKLPGCDDQIHNGDETDTDCGGGCEPCQDGQVCESGNDCVGLYCEEGICQTPACDDGVKNGDETDTDCGADCPGCQAGMTCALDGDCVADALCQANVCSIYGDGQDGSIEPGNGTVTLNATASPASGTAGADTLSVDAGVTFAPGQRVLIHQTTGPDAGWWEERLVVLQDGDTLYLSSALSRDYLTQDGSKAQVVVMPQYQDVTLTAQTLTAPAWNGSTGGILAFAAAGQVSLQGGTIDMSARGFRGKQHGCSYRCQDGWAGESAAGDMGSAVAPAANGMGGGGGQRGQDCAAGGGGGYGTAGTNGTNGSKGSCHIGNHLGGLGGAEGGIADTRERILFGGAGGEGGGDEDGGYPGKGGTGGGIVIVKAPQITITGGTIQLNGATGNHGYQGCGSGGGMGGGGGGAGGGAWLRADTVSLATGKVSATGGNGGKCAPSNSSHPGGTGGNGRIAVRAGEITGTSTPDWVESE